MLGATRFLAALYFSALTKSDKPSSSFSYLPRETLSLQSNLVPRNPSADAVKSESCLYKTFDTSNISWRVSLVTYSNISELIRARSEPASTKAGRNVNQHHQDSPDDPDKEWWFHNLTLSLQERLSHVNVSACTQNETGNIQHIPGPTDLVAVPKGKLAKRAALSPTASQSFKNKIVDIIIGVSWFVLCKVSGAQWWAGIGGLCPLFFDILIKDCLDPNLRNEIKDLISNLFRRIRGSHRGEDIEAGTDRGGLNRQQQEGSREGVERNPLLSSAALIDRPDRQLHVENQSTIVGESVHQDQQQNPDTLPSSTARLHVKYEQLRNQSVYHHFNNSVSERLESVTQKLLKHGFGPEIEAKVKSMIQRGALMYDKNAWGVYNNALQAAAFVKDMEKVQTLIGDGANVNEIGGIFGSALEAASFQGHKEIVEYLLNAGADVNAKGGAFDTALQAASLKGKVSIVEALLGKNANVNEVGGLYHNALRAAASQGWEVIIQLLLDKGASDLNGALAEASRGNHGRAAKVLADYMVKSEEQKKNE